jgi:hypothetical protein
MTRLARGPKDSTQKVSNTKERTMTTDFHRGSAKIYQFPTRPRQALGGARPGEIPAPANLTPHVAAACGSAWYHEAALQDAGLAGKN